MGVDDGVDARGQWLQLVEHLPGQVGGAFGSLDGRTQQVAAWITSRQVRQCQGHIAENGRQQIVEVVSDTTCQLADGFHLLCLPELSLQLPLLGHVPENAEYAHNASLVVLDRRLDHAHQPWFAGRNVLFFQLQALAFFQHLAIVGTILLGQRPRIKVEIGLADQVRLGAPQAAGKRLGFDDGELDGVERLLSVPAILRSLDADQINPVRNFRRLGGLVQAREAALHATLSCLPR